MVQYFVAEQGVTSVFGMHVFDFGKVLKYYVM